MPSAEIILWAQLKGDKLGVRFYRQRPIGSYIVDFYCPRVRLVIELDGSQHFMAESEAYDAERDAYVHALGLRVLRVANNEVLTNLRGVIEKILTFLP